MLAFPNYLHLFWCNTLYRASSHFTKSFQSSQNLRFRTVESTTIQRKFSKTVVGWACQRLIDIHQWYAGCKFFRDQHMTWRIIGFNHRDRRGFIADDLLQRLFCRIFFGNGHKWCDHLLKRRTKRHLTRKYWKDS